MENLIGKLLIATPCTEPGSYFDRSVIYIIKSNAKGSMGVMVNSPFLKLDGNVNVGLSPNNTKGMYIKELNTYSGGPVETEKGFILELEKQSRKSQEVIKISSSIESLKAISKKIKPKYSMFLFGYCGWDSGQLERELENDHWILSPSSKDLIFNVDDKEKWTTAMKKMNITPTQYSYHTGRC